MFGTTSSNQAEARESSAERICDHPDCAEAGDHRAPRSRDALDSYFWFCIDHARSYNAAWNFFGDMDRQAIEDYQKEDVTWHRPTWRMGGPRRAGDAARISAAWRRGDFTDPYSIFEDGDAAAARDPGLRRMPAPERDALAVLNLPSTATDNDIKARYKELVKRLHPDVNGEDAQAVNQLKTVIKAYRTLSKRVGA